MSFFLETFWRYIYYQSTKTKHTQVCDSGGWSGLKNLKIDTHEKNKTHPVTCQPPNRNTCKTKENTHRYVTAWCGRVEWAGTRDKTLRQIYSHCHATNTRVFFVLSIRVGVDWYCCRSDVPSLLWELRQIPEYMIRAKHCLAREAVRTVKKVERVGA